MSSSFKFGCVSCHFFRGCKEDRKSEYHCFQKPRLIFCSNPQRSLWLEVEESSSGTERRTSPMKFDESRISDSQIPPKWGNEGGIKCQSIEDLDK
ncbi:hypothetical protein TNCV_1774571 [Trichonephila clavipes]|nr:hypothetical protein TNCV_1774571 [Trichonephila clavipes]